MMWSEVSGAHLTQAKGFPGHWGHTDAKTEQVSKLDV